ncbi:MAG: Type 1 glutamine amidotransferase-like domain-containing protein [Patescibacteria group bacterium]
MKLLLASAGITNQSIADTLVGLVGKSAKESKIGFVSTAVNVQEGNKDWYITQLTNLQKYGFSWIDMIDISVPGVDWKDRLASVDVIVVSGGNTFYLLDQVRKTKFDEWLKGVLNEKVYVGISAGSILMTPTIAVSSVEPGDKNTPELTDVSGLGYVDFEVSPHVPDYISYESVEEYVAKTKKPLYAIDDQTAIKVVDGKIDVVSEGKWNKYN